MSTETALLLLVAVLTTGALLVVAVGFQRLTGSVRLDLDLGATSPLGASAKLARALTERDQARALAEALRNASATVTSQGTQVLRTEVTGSAENHPEASVKAELFTAPEEK